MTTERPYSVSKPNQERLALNAGEELGVETRAALLRHLGPRQALTNPYTGVFSLRQPHSQRPSTGGLRGRPPVARLRPRRRPRGRASRRARGEQLPQRVINVGSGRARTLDGAGARDRPRPGPRLEPEVAGRYRLGDVRHIIADIARIGGSATGRKLSWRKVSRDTQWLKIQTEVPDGFADAEREAASARLLGEVAGIVKRALVTSPIYNERARIEAVLARVRERLPRACDMLFVDNASTDGTPGCWPRPASPSFAMAHRQGCGPAVRTGLEEAQGRGYEIAVVMAGNGKDDPGLVGRLVEPILERGYDFVQGSRYLPGGSHAHMPIHRRTPARAPIPCSFRCFVANASPTAPMAFAPCARRS